jgi:hypothetical protein
VSVSGKRLGEAFGRLRSMLPIISAEARGVANEPNTTNPHCEPERAPDPSLPFPFGLPYRRHVQTLASASRQQHGTPPGLRPDHSREPNPA